MSRVFLAPGFIAVNVVLLLVSAVTAVFFQFHQYLSSLGIGEQWAGLIIGADSIAALAFQPLLAPFLTERNARWTLVVALLATAAALVLYGGARTAGALFMVRLFQGAGFICVISALMVLVVRYIPPRLSGQGFGLLSLVRLVPYALVPPVVTSVVSHPSQFPHVLQLGALTVTACLGAVFFLGKKNEADAGRDGMTGFRGMGETVRDMRLMRLFGASLFMYTGYAVVFFYISGYCGQTGVGNGAFFLGTATVAMIVIRAVGSSFFDRARKAWIVSWCLAGLCLAFLALGFLQTPIAFFVLALAFGTGWGILMPLLTAMVFDLSPPRLRGMNLNLVMVTLQMGFFVGPALAGVVLKVGGYTALFGSCGALSLLAVLLVSAVNRAGRHALPGEGNQTFQ